MRSIHLSCRASIVGPLVVLCMQFPMLQAQYNWVEIGPPGFNIKDVFYQDDTFYLIGEDPAPALAISTDQGNTWVYPSMTNGPSNLAMELIVGTGYQGTIHIFGFDLEQKIWCSENNGATFTLPGQGWLQNTDTYLTGFYRGGFNDFLYGYGNELARSGPGGGSCPSFLPTANTGIVTGISAKWDTLFVVTESGQIYTSTNAAGASWSDITPASVQLGGAGHAIAMSGENWRLFAAGAGDGIISSVDNGVTWFAATDGITTAGPIIDIASSYFSQQVIAVQQDHAYVSVNGGDTYISVDAGLEIGAGILGAGCGFWDGVLYTYTAEKLYVLNDISLGTMKPVHAVQPIHPQPTTGWVQFPGEWGNSSAELLDHAGRVVHQAHTGGDGWLDLSNMAPGNYIIRFPHRPELSPQRLTIAR
jgi:hypothetical protein